MYANQEVIKNLVGENSRSFIDQNEYNNRYSKCVVRYNKLKKKSQVLNSEIAILKARCNQIKAFIKEYEKQDKMIDTFDEGLWYATLNTMVVKPDKEIVFKFKDGKEVSWRIG